MFLCSWGLDVFCGVLSYCDGAVFLWSLLGLVFFYFGYGYGYRFVVFGYVLFFFACVYFFWWFVGVVYLFCGWSNDKKLILVAGDVQENIFNISTPFLDP